MSFFQRFRTAFVINDWKHLSKTQNLKNVKTGFFITTSALTIPSVAYVNVMCDNFHFPVQLMSPFAFLVGMGTSLWLRELIVALEPRLTLGLLASSGLYTVTYKCYKSWKEES